ncbi:MAG: hypothetical protein EBX41_10930 [Chitinophagia bacterium]|nr:hypothetical protein [Chitinophagia bacterium]
MGEIKNEKMHFSQIGAIAYNEWLNTPILRKNIELGAFIIMPNHLHGIVIINKKNGNSEDIQQKLEQEGSNNIPKSPSQTIGAIVRGYKSAVVKISRLSGYSNIEPLWQRNYYEHIIKSHEAHLYIENYINSNPQTWQIDSLYTSK